SRGHHGGHASTQSRLTHPLIGFLQGPARNTHPGTQVHTPREQSDFSQINVLSGRLHGPVPGDALDAATADPHGGRSDPRRGDHAFGSDQDVELAHRVPSVLVAENTFRGSTRGMVGRGDRHRATIKAPAGNEVYRDRPLPKGWTSLSVPDFPHRWAQRRRWGGYQR